MCDKQIIPLASSSIALQATQNDKGNTNKMVVCDRVCTNEKGNTGNTISTGCVEHHRLTRVTL
jgi:hypothetical protein